MTSVAEIGVRGGLVRGVSLQETHFVGYLYHVGEDGGMTTCSSHNTDAQY